MFIRNKKLRLRLYHVLTVLVALSLLLGCVFTLTGKNFFAFIFSITLPILAVINLIFLFFWGLKRDKHVFYPLFGLIVFFLCFNSFVQLNVKKEKSCEDSISILTYNVQGFGKIKNHEISQFIDKQDCDIVVLQEFSFFRLKKFEQYPYSFVSYRPDVTKSMQIILSKFPISDKGFLDFPNTRNNAMFADIKYRDEIIRVYNVHLQSFWVKLEGGESYINRRSKPFKTISTAQKMRIDQTQMILDHAKDFDGPIMICGDFNSTQFSSTYKALKENRKDSFVEAGKGLGTTYSLFKYPLRLDYVLVDKEFDVVSHQNFNLNLSDHEPVLVELVKN